MELPVVGKVKNPFPWILGTAIGGTLLVGVIATVATINAVQSRGDVEELTIPAKEEALLSRIRASGTIVPLKSVNISPKNSGRLQKLLVDRGVSVKAGQPLAAMENAEIRAQGMQAEANVKQAIAALQEADVKIQGEIAQYRARVAQADARLKEAQQRIPAQIRQAEQQVNAAGVRLKLSQIKVERNKNLLEQGAISQDRFDELGADMVGAQADFLESQQRLREVSSTTTPEIRQLDAALAEAKFLLQQRQASQTREIARLQAAVESAKAELNRIQVLFNDTVIRAPFDGIITQKYATEGAFVTPTTSASSTASATSTSILAIAQGLEIVAKVPEVDVAQLLPGQAVQIVADAYPDRTFRGRVKHIAPEAIVEQNVTSFEVRIQIDTGLEQLRSGMNVDVTFIGQQLSSTIVVPTVAIVTEEGKQGVMVIGADNKPKFQPVTIGRTIGEKTQILDGLEPGERVFIDLPEGSQPKL